MSEIDLKGLLAAKPPDEIETVAQQHARTAVAALVERLVNGASEAAKVAAANEVLDRGYGKPAVDIGGDAMLPLMLPPTAAQTLGSEIRTEARRFARLAIEVLRRISDHGQSESASVQASKSLLNRGLGTVATARMPDEFNPRPLGKKEQAAEAARLAGKGRYATPSRPGLQ